MYLESLDLKNIGPFKHTTLEFVSDVSTTPPVVFITGENGTGKTIILDAIRGLYGRDIAGPLDRDLRRRQSKTNQVKGCFVHNNQTMKLESTSVGAVSLNFPIGPKEPSTSILWGSIAHQVVQNSIAPNWIVDYWPSVLASGSFEISNLANPKHKHYLSKALSGQRNNRDVTNMICHFDYVRDSRDPREKAIGQKMYKVLEKAIEHSLLDGGKLKYVSRSNLEPILEQNGQEIWLQNLSSGNLYLIQSLISLLSKMYSINTLRNESVDMLCNSQGILLIDEAENQLHPKWQKRLIKTILKFFPNLQIIATTHSPFIIASVENAKLFVCKAMGDHCVVEDVSADYSNKPVDEILMSPLFEGTQPFSEKITNRIEARKQAILAGDEVKRRQLEVELKRLNPNYFGYFDLDNLIADMLESNRSDTN